MNLTPESATTMVLGMTCVAVALSSAEMTRSRVVLQDTNLMSWRTARLSSRAFVKYPFVFDRLFNYRNALLLYYLRLMTALAGCVVFLFHVPSLRTPVTAVLVSLLALTQLRTRIGQNGADQCTLFVLTCWLICATLFTDSTQRHLAFLFSVTAQASICYAAAGLAKARGAKWRNGTALAGILQTHAYGAAVPTAIFRRWPSVGKACGWCVMTWECAFAPCLLLGPTVTMAMLGIGVAFHAGTAIFMGLNDFLFAFVALYPAVLFVTTFLF